MKQKQPGKMLKLEPGNIYGNTFGAELPNCENVDQILPDKRRRRRRAWMMMVMVMVVDQNPELCDVSVTEAYRNRSEFKQVQSQFNEIKEMAMG